MSMMFQGADCDYDQRLIEYFSPYHSFVDMYIRLYVNMLHDELGAHSDHVDDDEVLLLLIS